MPKVIKYNCLALLVLLSAACTSTTRSFQFDDPAIDWETRNQMLMYVEQQLEEQKRIQSVAYPILRRGVEICANKTRPAAGLLFANEEVWPESYREVINNEFGIGAELKVIHVMEGSAADQAGINEGDVILSIANQQIGQGRPGVESAFELLTEPAAQVDVPIPIQLRRGQTQIDTDAVPQEVCNSYVISIANPEINAYADGDDIFITHGMMRFVETDAELATVIAHEIAHNSMGHGAKKSTNMAIGAVLDAVVDAYAYSGNTFQKLGGKAFSKGFEAEADYVGTYLADAGGFDIEQSAGFWRRMGVEHPGTVRTGFLGTHPGTVNRFLFIEQTAEEIEAKKRRGLPLLPDSKGAERVADRLERPR